MLQDVKLIFLISWANYQVVNVLVLQPFLISCLAGRFGHIWIWKQYRDEQRRNWSDNLRE